MTDVDESDLLFPRFGLMALKERNDNKIDSKVSELWTSTYLQLVHMSESLKERAAGSSDDVTVLNAKLSSHHAKKGASVTLSNSRACGLPQIFRAGWEVRNVHSLFDYIHGTKQMDRESAKALANWSFELFGSIYGGYPPVLSDVTRERGKVGEFVSVLFSGADGFNSSVLELLAASLLMRFDAVVHDIMSEPTGKYNDPNDHPFVQAVKRAKEMSHISDDVFDSWKLDTNNGFMTRNRPALAIDYSPEMHNVMMDPRTILSAYNSLVTAQAAMQGK